jgi:hypothetical protein
MSIVRHHGVIHVRVIPERTRTFERPGTVVGPWYRRSLPQPP